MNATSSARHRTRTSAYSFSMARLPDCSFLRFQHCQGDTLHSSDSLQKKNQTVKRMVPSQSSLADICMCAVSSVLVIDMNWIAAGMSYQLYIYSNTGKTMKGNVIPATTGFLEAVTQQHQQQHNLPNTRLRCLASFRFFSYNSAKDTLFTDLNDCENGNCEENGSLRVVTA